LTVKVFPGLKPRLDAAIRWREAHGLADDLMLVLALIRRRWMFLVAAVLFWAGFGLWVGLKTPALYESETTLIAMESPSPIFPYSTKGDGNLSNRELHKTHLVTILRSETVLYNILADFKPEEWPALVGHSGPLNNVQVVDRLRRDLVRVRMKKDSPIIMLYLRAGDSALTARLSEAFLRRADELVKTTFRETARVRILALERSRATTADPELLQGIASAIASERERAELMGGRSLEVLSGPHVLPYRVLPKRKLVLALSLSMGFSVTLLLLMLADRPTREHFVKVRKLEMMVGFDPPRDPSIWQDLVAVPLLFVVLHNLSFKVAPSLTTARLVFATLFLLLLIKGIRPLIAFVRAHFLSLFMLGLVLVHAAVGYLLGSRESIQSSRIVELFYHSLLGPVLLLAFTGRDWNRFHLRVMLAALAQSILHIYSFVSFGFREFVAAHLTQLGNTELTYAIMPPGFSNGAGAIFSVVQALGLISTLVTMRHAKSGKSILFCGVAATLILVSASVSGRTGMLISLLMMGLFALRSGTGLRIAVLSALGTVIALFVFFVNEIKFLVGLLGDDLDWQLNSILKRSFEIFKLKGKTNSLQELVGMYIPPLNHETFFGTGVVRAVFGARHDSGYVQAYNALGLPMAALFYGAIFLFVVRMRASLPLRVGREVWLFFWLIVLMFLLDVKEPFITHSITFYTVAALLAYASPQHNQRMTVDRGA
jgi:hypothetical protein